MSGFYTIAVLGQAMAAEHNCDAVSNVAQTVLPTRWSLVLSGFWDYMLAVSTLWPGQNVQWHAAASCNPLLGVEKVLQPEIATWDEKDVCYMCPVIL